MLTWFHQLSLPACYKPVFTRGGLLLVCASSAPNRWQKLRNKREAGAGRIWSVTLVITILLRL
jgi:hypothetical protein